MALFVIISFPLLFLSFLCGILATFSQKMASNDKPNFIFSLLTHFQFHFDTVWQEGISRMNIAFLKNHGFVYRPNEQSLLGRKKFIFQNVGFHFWLHCSMISYWVEVIQEGRYLLSGPTLTFPGDKTEDNHAINRYQYRVGKWKKKGRIFLDRRKIFYEDTVLEEIPTPKKMSMKMATS